MKTITILISFIILVACSSESTKKEKAESKKASSEEKEDKKAVIAKDLIEINTDEALISTALMAAPEESRSACKVIGYNMKGEFVTLKEGENEFICLADNPKEEGFSAACYHKSLEPFMARGRELRAEGKSSSEVFDIREEEVKSGKLKMGEAGATLHIYYGSNTKYDQKTSEVAEAKYRYVVYMPWATSESTGLPESPFRANHPWIMNPGTHKAHIMISPIPEETN